MTKREKYFLKQKLTGLFAMIIAVIMGPVMYEYEALICSVVLGSLGLALMLTKDMVIVDDYFNEVEKRKGRRL